MDHVVIVAVIQHMHPKESGQAVAGVDHHPRARRAVPAEFAQDAGAANAVVDPGAHAQGIGKADPMPAVEGAAALGASWLALHN